MSGAQGLFARDSERLESLIRDTGQGVRELDVAGLHRPIDLLPHVIVQIQRKGILPYESNVLSGSPKTVIARHFAGLAPRALETARFAWKLASMSNDPPFHLSRNTGSQ